MLVDGAWLEERLGDPGLRILDATVRLATPAHDGDYRVASGREDHARAHIPGAGFADLLGDLSDPRGEFTFTIPSPERLAQAFGAMGVGEDTTVVAYDDAGGTWSTRLWFLLRVAGFDRVAVLDGGLPGWRAEGRPLESGPPPVVAPARFDARPRPELVATRDEVLALSREREGGCLLNALPEASYRGDVPTRYSRRGRIPGSVSLPTGRLIDAATQRHLDVDAQRAAVQAAGIDPSTRVVCYCGGGISATVDAFVLTRLGFTDVAVYDGSLAEWSADPALPLETG